MKKRLIIYLCILASLFIYILVINTTTNTFASLKVNNEVIEAENYNFNREMRGTWVASFNNLHLPNGGLNEEEFTQWADTLTSSIASLNFNTIIFQVRPMGDALYSSELVPISHFINGANQGAPIDYDPLDILIKLSHSKGLEFHAWLNPYRITNANVSLNELSPSNFAVKNPDWVIHHNGMVYLDPGIPEVKQHIVDVVMEIVSNYDIDAIHFDDYFYPSEDFADIHSYQAYGEGFTNIEDWRRNNVNTLIEEVYNSIKEIKPWVQFGISPFGIWRNLNTDATGSNTSGKQSYDSMFADSREWISRGILDYITPQLYWSTQFDIANYEILKEWWSKQIEVYANNKPVNLYIGTADYKVNDTNQTDEAWLQTMQIPTQIELNRANPTIKGQMHYAVIHLFQNELGYMDIIRDNMYNTLALTPSIYWKDDTVPNAPSNVTATNTLDGVEIKIDTIDENTRRYVIYRFNEGENISFENEYILGVIYKSITDTFIDASTLLGQTYTYAVRSISPTGVISNEYITLTHTH